MRIEAMIALLNGLKMAGAAMLMATMTPRDAPAQIVTDPVVFETRVGLQCDAAANRAYLRVGTAARGGAARYIDLPAEAPATAAPVIDIVAPSDRTCRLRDGTEIRVRHHDTARYNAPDCSSESVTVWVAARRVQHLHMTTCAFTEARIYQDPLRRIAWILTPQRIDACVRNDAHLAGPAVQSRVLGDPRSMGVRDWLEYPANGRRRDGSGIGVQYALDMAFCRRFIRRGVDGAPDALVVPHDFARPVFTGEDARFDVDNDGVARAVRRYVHDGSIWWDRSERLLADRSYVVRDAFFHQGKTYLLTSTSPGYDSMAHDIGRVILPVKGIDRMICRFRDSGGEGDVSP